MSNCTCACTDKPHFHIFAFSHFRIFAYPLPPLHLMILCSFVKFYINLFLSVWYFVILLRFLAQVCCKVMYRVIVLNYLFFVQSLLFFAISISCHSCIIQSDSRMRIDDVIFHQPIRFKHINDIIFHQPIRFNHMTSLTNKILEFNI